MANAELNAVISSVRRMTGGETLSHLTDYQLLQLYRARANQDAFAHLLNRHGAMVYGVCRRVLNDHHEAQDVFQATFLALAKSGFTIRKPSSLASWLHSVARHLASNLRKANMRRRTHQKNWPAPTQSAAGPDLSAAWQELHLIIDEEINLLPAVYREPFILCCLENKSCAEMARTLRVREGTVWSRIGRAKERLRKRLVSRGITLPMALAAIAATTTTADAALPTTLVRSTISAAALLSGSPTISSQLVSARAAELLQESTRSGALCLSKNAVLFLFCAMAVTAGIGLAAAPWLPDSPSSPSQPAQRAETEPENAPVVDADGRSLPSGAVARLGSRRYRLEGRNDLALASPDGKYVLVHPHCPISGSPAHGLILMDAETGLRVRLLEDSCRVSKRQSSETFHPAVFSPDGKKVYGLGWDKTEEAGTHFYVWDNFDSPCKRVLLTWDVETGKLLSEWELPDGGARGASLMGLSISADGKLLYVFGAIQMGVREDRRIQGSPGVHIFDAATGNFLNTWQGAGYPVGRIAGKQEVLTFRNNMIVAYDEPSGKPARTFPVEGYIPCAILNPTREIVAALDIVTGKGPKKCEIKFWNAATGREVRRLAADPKVAGHWSRLAFSPNGEIIYLGGDSGQILRWNVRDGKPLPGWQAHNSYFADLIPRPGSRELISVGSDDSALNRWDPDTGKSLAKTTAYVGEVAFAFAVDRKSMACVDELGRLELWDLSRRQVTKTAQTPGRKRHVTVFSPDGKQLLIGAEKGPSSIWDLEKNQKVGEFAQPPKLNGGDQDGSWQSLAFSASGTRLLASRTGFGTWMWAWPERKLLWRDPADMESCFFPTNDTVLCSNWHAPIQFRDTETGALKRTAPVQGMSGVAFSADGRRMVTTHLSEGRGLGVGVGVWRLRDGITGNVLKEVEGLQYLWSADFSPTGWLLAVCTDKSVRVYDTPSWQEVARFDGHEGTVRTVFFGPDDRTLFSASPEDGSALVWTLETSASRQPPAPTDLWADLAGKGPAIRRAVLSAARHPEIAIPLFKQKWPLPFLSSNPDRVSKLIEALGTGTRASREVAAAELAELGESSRAGLEKALGSPVSAEVRNRLSLLLGRLPRQVELPADEARQSRAVWALELAGTPEAKALLHAWANEKAGLRMCTEAAAAVKRMEGRRPTMKSAEAK
jgi:RNA polymerase sigma factor (sigma-70 family)